MTSTREFARSSTYLYLFKSLVRSQLEYAVPVWNPFYIKYVDIIEKVQRKFLRAMQFRCCRSSSGSYRDLLKKYNLQDLKSRRITLDTTFLFDICNNVYDCIDICNKISYVVPRTAMSRVVRPRPVFATASCRTNAGKRAPIRRLTSNYNKFFHDIDLFYLTPNNFRRIIRKKVFDLVL